MVESGRLAGAQVAPERRLLQATLFRFQPHTARRCRSLALARELALCAGRGLSIHTFVFLANAPTRLLQPEPVSQPPGSERIQLRPGQVLPSGISRTVRRGGRIAESVSNSLGNDGTKSLPVWRVDPGRGLLLLSPCPKHRSIPRADGPGQPGLPFLEVREAERKRGPPSNALRRQTRRMKMGEQLQILVVDDDKSIVRWLSAVLTAEGYKVQVAQSVKDAEPLLQEGPFDLALLDIYVGSGNGLDFLEKLKAAQPHSNYLTTTTPPNV